MHPKPFGCPQRGKLTAPGKVKALSSWLELVVLDLSQVVAGTVRDTTTLSLFTSNFGLLSRCSRGFVGEPEHCIRHPPSE
jgi:hypothetical protein